MSHKSSLNSEPIRFASGFTRHKLQLRMSTNGSLCASTMKIVITTLVVIMICTTNIQQVHSVCPNPQLIRPCTCDDDGLQCLNLNDTGLMRVFHAPAEHKAIRRVWIFQTNLTSLQNRAFGDYIIRELYLDLNQISRIEPGAFGEAVKTLQSLSLTRNKLSKFAFRELDQMTKLKQLGLGHNQLTEIPSKAFGSIDTLESLDLSHNKIHRIGPYAFENLHEASLIDLSRNELRELTSNSLAVNSSGRHLFISLRNNQIQQIAPDAFGEYHPQSIDLARNNLTYLDETVFSPLLANRTLISVDSNPLSCFGCEQYKWLIDFEHQSNLRDFACKDGSGLEDLTLDMIGCTQPSTEDD